MHDTDRRLLDALVDRERELRALEGRLRDATPNARDYSTGGAYEDAARLHDELRADLDAMVEDVVRCASTWSTASWNASRAQRVLRRTSMPRRPDYDHYVVVLSSAEATIVANVLASVGLMLDGVTLTLRDDDGVLAEVSPQHVREAHAIVLDALRHRWLGTHDSVL